MNRTRPVLLAACGIAALAFTFSCSSDDDGGGGNTGGGSGCSINGYGTVKIGNQTWMAENFNCEVDGSKCYGNDLANCVTYGRLYDWATAKEVCPSGWHLPSDDEWDELMTTVGGSSNAGTKLKATSGWNNSGSGTDEYGFSALPGGYGFGTSFSSVGDGGSWWSTTEGGSSRAYLRGMDYDYSSVSRYNFSKTDLFSVRCLQD